MRGEKNWSQVAGRVASCAGQDSIFVPRAASKPSEEKSFGRSRMEELPVGEGAPAGQ